MGNVTRPCLRYARRDSERDVLWPPVSAGSAPESISARDRFVFRTELPRPWHAGVAVDASVPRSRREPRGDTGRSLAPLRRREHGAGLSRRIAGRTTLFETTGRLPAWSKGFLRDHLWQPDALISG